MRTKKGKIKYILSVAVIIVIILLLTVIGAFLNLKIKTYSMSDDYSEIFRNDKYSKPVYVSGVKVIKQKVSCGYAVMEMIGLWNGHEITEETLFNEYGKIVTSTGKSFCDEMNKRFPEYKTDMHRYMKNTELIDAVYDSLDKGIPVPFEWAALYNDEWTLHYSLIIGMDIPNDKVYVANPYGYNEEITTEEFLKRTGFEAYEDMPWFLQMGFAFGIFEKNTIFILSDLGSGSCDSKPGYENWKLRFYKSWKWTEGEEGTSIIEEI